MPEPILFSIVIPNWNGARQRGTVFPQHLTDGLHDAILLAHAAAFADGGVVVVGRRIHVIGPVADYSVPDDIPGLEVRAAAPASHVRELLRDARVIVLPSRAEGMPMIPIVISLFAL